MANSLPDQTENPLSKRQEDADQAKILVVDDRPENLLVSRTMLDELGYEVITVRLGRRGAEIPA